MNEDPTLVAVSAAEYTAIIEALDGSTFLDYGRTAEDHRRHIEVGMVAEYAANKHAGTGARWLDDRRHANGDDQADDHVLGWEVKAVDRRTFLHYRGWTVPYSRCILHSDRPLTFAVVYEEVTGGARPVLLYGWSHPDDLADHDVRPGVAGQPDYVKVYADELRPGVPTNAYP